MVIVIPIVITKDAYGFSWETVWDRHTTNELVTGVAIGRDVLNDGQTIG